MRSTLCRITLGLWILTFGVAGWFFVQGWTAQGIDGRTQIMLAPAERDLILGEMRLLLKAVHGVVTGLAGQGQEVNRTQMEQVARSAGMHMAEDVNPALMAKLPLPFKQMGMSIHHDMDALADAIANKETSQQILQRLSSMTSRCTTCHDVYRFSVER
ncbi:MAG: cytochrome c [Nitrospiraceae bacterium]|nr:cytochrome c [Nitrospiraceae bacterium]